MHPAEWTGVFQDVHLRLRGRENGIVQVTRDLEGQFRATPYSAVCDGPEGKWNRQTEKGEIVFTLPGLSVRVNPETGALTFRDAGGNLLLRENPESPAVLQPVDIRCSVFSEDAKLEEKSCADGMRASTDPSGPAVST